MATIFSPTKLENVYADRLIFGGTIVSVARRSRWQNIREFPVLVVWLTLAILKNFGRFLIRPLRSPSLKDIKTPLPLAMIEKQGNRSLWIERGEESTPLKLATTLFKTPMGGKRPGRE